MSEPLLRVSEITAVLGKQRVLSNISMVVNAGEIVSVIGPNGAGKSSLLSAIVGDLAVQSGEVKFVGRALNALPANLRARQIAFLMQRNNLDFNFTGFDVVAMSRTPHATDTYVNEAICRDAMAQLDVAHLANRSFMQLSGGEQQRLQIARVLSQIWRAEDAKDRLLLLDEPISSLDIRHQGECMEAIKRFTQSGAAVLMTMHDVTLAGAYSDKILALHDGEAIAFGSPKSVLTVAILERVFSTKLLVVNHPESGDPIVVR